MKYNITCLFDDLSDVYEGVALSETHSGTLIIFDDLERQKPKYLFPKDQWTFVECDVKDEDDLLDAGSCSE
jgi:hypothetical protein